MELMISGIGLVSFEELTMLEYGELELYGAKAFEILQEKTIFPITSVVLSPREDQWYLFASLDIPKWFSEKFDDTYISKIKDKSTIHRLNAFL